MPFSPKLCGSTLLYLLIDAKIPPVQNSKHFENAIDSTRDFGVLTNLVRILYPSLTKNHYDDETLKKYTTKYKQGQGGYYGWLPFDNDNIWIDSESFFDQKYSSALKNADSFCRTCLNFDNDAAISLLGRRILEIIKKDESIGDDEKFYINPNNSFIVKNQINPTMSYNIQGLILGTWHYIIKNKISSELGRETIKHWQSSTDEPTSFINLGRNEFRQTFIGKLQEDDANLQNDEEQNSSINYVNYYDFSSYLEKLKDNHTSIKTFIYAEGTHEFKDFYVCNDLRCRSSEKNEYGNHPQIIIKNVAATELREKCSNYVIISGSGGLGKSMMMNHLLLSAIDSYENDRLVPVFVLLNEFKKETGYLDEFIFKTIKELTEFITKDQFYSLLKAGTFLFLLDGLDEIESSERGRFEKQINDFTAKYSNNAYIISSRVDSDFGSLNKFEVAELLPFDKQKAIKMVDKLDYVDDKKLKDEFKKRLDKDLFDKHNDFASNPLLLTILLITYDQTSDIPGENHKFFKDAFDALARSHDSHKSGYHREYYTHTSGERIGDYLTEICYYSYTDGIKDFEKSEFEEYLKDAKKEIGKVDETFTCQELLDDLMYSLCILKMNAGKYYFVHQSFQEYFCATKLSQFNDEELKIVGGYFNDNPRFEPVFRLLYEMNTRKVEEFIFFPYLDEIFKNRTDEDAMLYFLNQMYESIIITSGEVDKPKKNTSIEALYSFIATNVKKYKTSGYVEDFEHYKEFVEKAYFISDVADQYTVSEIEPGLEPEAEKGWDMIVIIDDLIKNKETYRRIIDELSSTPNDLKEEFDSTKAYYLQLKNNVSQHKNSLRNRINRNK